MASAVSPLSLGCPFGVPFRVLRLCFFSLVKSAVVDASFAPEAAMNDRYAARVTSLLHQLYQQAKETGTEDAKRQDFIRGYMAAGLHTGLIDKASLETIIDAAHHDVFGMSISQTEVSPFFIHISVFSEVSPFSLTTLLSNHAQ